MIRYFDNIEQGTPEWKELRSGIVTASSVHRLFTPGGEVSKSDKVRQYAFEVAAERINGPILDTYQSEDMMRGSMDEPYIKAEYEKINGELYTTGFITNDMWGFMIGYSPDGIPADESKGLGLIEAKSKKQNILLQLIVSDSIEHEHLLQVQTGLLVSQREWCDLIYYRDGMKLYIRRIYADQVMQDKIIAAVKDFYDSVDSIISQYESKDFIKTEKRSEEIFV